MARRDYASIKGPSHAEIKRLTLRCRHLNERAELALQKAIDYLNIASAIAQTALAKGCAFDADDAAAIASLSEQRATLDRLIAQTREQGRSL